MKDLKKQKIKNRIKLLISQINHWNYFYYEKSRSQVSDQIYDKNFEELKELEKQNPEFLFYDTPTKKIGFNISNFAKKIEHYQPMLSLNNAFNQEDLYAFDKRITKITKGKHTYYCEPKVDGLPVSLIFKNGRFFSAATRGNGIIGENVTPNVQAISNIKKNLFQKQKFQNFDIRGEVFLTKENFKKLNLNLFQKKKNEFFSKRNSKKKNLKI